MKDLGKKLALLLVGVLFLLNAFPQGTYAGETPQAPCPHTCGTQEVCTGDAATCPHAQHVPDACLPQQAPCAHVCGTGEACAGDGAACPHAQHPKDGCAQQKVPCAHACGTTEACTEERAACPHAGHEANACAQEEGEEDEEDDPALLHTVRFFATQAEVETGSPIATASVENGGALTASAFPSPADLKLEEGAQVVWRMEDDSLLLPDETTLTYETATEVDVYAEVLPVAAAAPPLKGAANGIVIKADETELTPDSNGRYELPPVKIPSGNIKGYIWKDKNNNYYLPECIYEFDADTTLEQVKIIAGGQATLTLSDGKDPATEVEFTVPRVSLVILPVSGVFGDSLITTWNWTINKVQHSGSEYDTQWNNGQKITIYVGAGTPPPPTYTVSFVVDGVPAGSFAGIADGTLWQDVDPAITIPVPKTGEAFFWTVEVGDSTETGYAAKVSNDPNTNATNKLPIRANLTFKATSYIPLPQGAQLVYKWQDASVTYDGTPKTHRQAEGELYLRDADGDDEFDPADYGLTVTHLEASATGTDVKRDASLNVVGYPMLYSGSIVLERGTVDVTSAYGTILYEAGELLINPVDLSLVAQSATVKYGDAAVLTFTMQGTIPAADLTGNGYMADLNDLFKMTGDWLTSGYDPANLTGTSFDIKFTQTARDKTAVTSTQTNYEVTLIDSLLSAGGGLTVTDAYKLTYVNPLAATPLLKEEYYNANAPVKVAAALAHNDYDFTGWLGDDKNPYAAWGDFTMPAVNLTLTAQWAFGANAFTLTGFNKVYDGNEASTALSGPLQSGDKVTYTWSGGSHSYVHGTGPAYNFTGTNVVNDKIAVVIERTGIEPYEIKNVPVVISPRPVTLTSNSGGPYLADTTSYTVEGFSIERPTTQTPNRGLLQGHVLSGITAMAQAYIPGVYPVAFSGSPVVTDTRLGGSGPNLAENYDFYTANGTLVLTAPGGGGDPAESPSTQPRPAAAAPTPEEPGDGPPAPQRGGGTQGQGTGEPPTEGPTEASEHLEQGTVPEAPPHWYGATNWGLVNLLVAVSSAVLGILLLLRLLRRNNGGRDKRRGLVWRALAILAGIMAPAVFLIFENFKARMMFVNSLTLWMVAILIFQVVAMLLLKLADYKDADEEA